MTCGLFAQAVSLSKWDNLTETEMFEPANDNAGKAAADALLHEINVAGES